MAERCHGSEVELDRQIEIHSTSVGRPTVQDSRRGHAAMTLPARVAAAAGSLRRKRRRPVSFRSLAGLPGRERATAR